MAFLYRCPFCTFEHRGMPADVGRKAQCSQCEFGFKIPAPAAGDMIADVAPRQQREGKTVWMWMGALAFVALLGVGLYAIYETRYGWESKHRAEMLTASAEAEDFLARGDGQKAFDDFAKIAAMGRGQDHLSDDLQEIIERAETQEVELAKKYGPKLVATPPAATRTGAIQSAALKKPAEPTTLAAITQPALVTAPEPATKPVVDAVAVSAAVPSTKPAEPLTPEQIYDNFSGSVALIKSAIASGTGFVVAPGQVLTNYHVINDSPIPQLRINFPAADGKSHAVTPTALLFADAKRDLAVLAIDATQVPLKFAANYSPKPGQKIVIIGFPNSDGKIDIKEGIMSNPDYPIDGSSFYALSIAINHGNSGGPVFNATGSVIGIATLKSRRNESTGWAVPYADALGAVAAAAKASPADVTRTTHDHNLVSACRRVSLMSGVYLRVMEIYVNAMNDAGPTGTATTLALAAAKADVQSHLTKSNAEAMADIEPLIKGFAGDKVISTTTRAKIAEEWAMYMEAKAYADSPRGPVKPYEAKLTELTERRVKAVMALQAALGVEDLLDDE